MKCLEYEPTVDDIINLCKNKPAGFKLNGLWVKTYEDAYNIME
jgi:hypothetical protein